MDRGIPTEEVLEEMRRSDPPVHYIVGTPKGRLSKFEKRFLERDWEQVRPGVEVKELAETGEHSEVWTQYIGLTEIEESFRNLKGDLAIRPIYHQNDERIEAHIFLSFLAYCLHVALRGKLRQLAGGLTPRAVFEKSATVQMLDVHLPAGRSDELVMPRHTEPDKDLKLLLARMGLELPKQPPPKTQAREPKASS